jgi:predicted esterase
MEKNIPCYSHNKELYLLIHGTGSSGTSLVDSLLDEKRG